MKVWTRERPLGGYANASQQSLIPVVMSGILAVYSLVIAVLIANDIGQPGQNYSLYKYECPQHPAACANGSQWLYASCSWYVGWVHQPRGRMGDWDSWGYGGSVLHEAIEDLCWHGFDIDFCRGSGSLWVSDVGSRGSGARLTCAVLSSG
jgi:hypothetical protein